MSADKTTPEVAPPTNWRELGIEVFQEILRPQLDDRGMPLTGAHRRGKDATLRVLSDLDVKVAELVEGFFNSASIPYDRESSDTTYNAGRDLQIVFALRNEHTKPMRAFVSGLFAGYFEHHKYPGSRLEEVRDNTYSFAGYAWSRLARQTRST